MPPSIRRRLASMLYESFLLLGVLSVAFVVPHLLIGMIWKAA
ncbi:MAG: RDD family protein, partial [Rhodocyclaceae bacterium]|nr:RDD family protein [Rhodocyclaceae bacterium]